MNWVEGLVSIAAVIGLCFIVDAMCTTVRYWLGERSRRGGGYPLPPPARNPGEVHVDVTMLGGRSPPGSE